MFFRKASPQTEGRRYHGTRIRRANQASRLEMNQAFKVPPDRRNDNPKSDCLDARWATV